VRQPLRGGRSGQDRAWPGEFLSRTYAGRTGTRKYKLYVPARHAGLELPLIVMLHGCKQSPDDFAAGTRMNDLAEQHGFLVAYPAQAPNANGARCWNWFRADDQQRDRGEPSLIAGILREIAAGYPVDRRRVYVAGLSAGAAMAVILGETYPELFAAVGAHSGLPYAAAHDVASAFTVMQNGSGGAWDGIANPYAAVTAAAATPAAAVAFAAAAAAASAAKSAASAAASVAASAAERRGLTHFVRTIVFHGDQDRTVDQRNGAEIVAQMAALAAVGQNAAPARAAAGAAGGISPSAAALRTTVTRGNAGGRAYVQTVYSDAANRPIIEQWLLQGAGHAWSGGSSEGSFTDGHGPDASAEMVRFFLAAGR
jgi:poly(hydroxyalkanoate) depolymerase family esterase